VYGAVDEKAGAVGSLWDVVRDRRLNHRPEVVAGVLPDECARLLTDFFRSNDGGRGPGPGSDFGAWPGIS
jgi:tRNA(adenine34) deaminase